MVRSHTGCHGRNANLNPKILNTEKEDNETGYRALVALGNIVSQTGDGFAYFDSFLCRFTVQSRKVH